MRIAINHSTSYSYGKPIMTAMQLMRLTPRSSANQFIRRWRVEIDADAKLDKSEDAYGNITHMAFIDGPLEAVNILIEGEVDTTDTGGVMLGIVERQPAQLFLRDTSLTEASAAIKDFARDAWTAESGELLAVLHKINSDLHENLRFDVTATNSSTTAAEAFNAQHGVCQDFSHVYIAAARSLNIPARYVSGYYLRTDTAEQDAGHAWAEALVPNLGWVGFDPANGLCVNDRYVRVAIGLDSREAAPVRGAQTGGQDEALSVSIRVKQGRLMSQSQS